MSANDKEVLELMVDFAEKLEQRIETFEITEELFNNDDAYADMLLMPVFQIGELANRLSEECTSALSDVPWHEIRGFRNVVAHDYGKLRLSWVWKTITRDVPELASRLKQYLTDELV